jgi:hypothetical protein
MDCTSDEKSLAASYIEFAGTRFADGSARFERVGADAVRDWSLNYPVLQGSGADWWQMVIGKRSLAECILRDVFGRETARIWHTTFERDVVAKFNYFGFRITAAEIAEWHLQVCQRSVRVA